MAQVYSGPGFVIGGGGRDPDNSHRWGFTNLVQDGDQIAGMAQTLGSVTSIQYSANAFTDQFYNVRTVSSVFDTGFSITILYALDPTLKSAIGGLLTVTPPGSPVGSTDKSAFSVANVPAFDPTNPAAWKTLTSYSLFTGNNYVSTDTYDNTVQLGPGNDFMWNQGGTDTAIFSGTKAQYTISIIPAIWEPVNKETDIVGPDGSDVLVNVQRIKFSDVTVAYESDLRAGEAYRLYQAAFNRTPDKAGLGFQINALDKGASLLSVAQNFIASPEFSAKYGALNDAQFVTQLYANVLHRTPDIGGLNFYLQELGMGITRAEVLMGFSESPENQVALVGVLSAGVDFIQV